MSKGQVMAVQVERWSAFPVDGEGGNRAGVVVDAKGLDEAAQRGIAADLGYSETVFLLPTASPRGFEARYFSPGAEVPFCGHATVAAAVALATRYGAGEFTFHTGVGDVLIRTIAGPDGTTATFTSVEPQVRPLSPEVLTELLGLLDLTVDDLDPALPARESFAGNWHPIVALASGDVFDSFGFDPAAVRALMDRQGWTGTVTIVQRRRPWLFEARNLFCVPGIDEDPATGSAAASLGGYLRDLGDDHSEFDIHQGHHVGWPCRLTVKVPASGGIEVSGTAVQLVD